MYQDRPVAEALIAFHPLDDQEGAGKRALAYTDAEGNFSLTVDKPGDGALPGRYVITVELRDLVQVGEELTRDGRHLLPAVYSRPETSPLSLQVAEGANEVPPLILTP
jgi:hypothetical protein